MNINMNINKKSNCNNNGMGLYSNAVTQRYSNFSRDSHRNSDSQCSHGHHTQTIKEKQQKQNKLNKKHAFLKKNSREFLATSKSTKKINVKQQMGNDGKNSGRISLTRNNSESKSLVTPKVIPNRIIAPQKPNNSKNNSFESIKNANSLSRNKTQSVQLQRLVDQDSIDIALNDTDILKPPQSKIFQRYYNKISNSSNQQKPQQNSMSSYFNKISSKQLFNSHLLHPKKPESNIQNNFNLANSVVTPNPPQSHLQPPGRGPSLLSSIANTNATSRISFLPAQKIQICPELLHLYRTEQLVYETNGDGFAFRIYSKGRKEIKYRNGTVQIYVGENNANQIRLTVWPNGDFRLVQGDKVSYWSQEFCDFDQYFLN